MQELLEEKGLITADQLREIRAGIARLGTCMRPRASWDCR